jgi:hypothetical protein
LRREIEARRRKLEREAIVAASALRGLDKENAGSDEASRPSTAESQRQMEDEGGWQDAAWLLSVASKALF